MVTPSIAGLSTTASPRRLGRRLLLVSAHRLFLDALTARSLRDAGFDVSLLAPAGHPLLDRASELSWISSAGRYCALNPAAAIRRSYLRAAFDFVLPLDDLSARAVFDAGEDRADELTGLAAVISRSLGDRTTFDIRHDRAAVGEIVAAAGMPTPQTIELHGPQQVASAVDLLGLPVVLKSDGSFGGQGVILAQNLAEAQAAYLKLATPPSLRSSLGRGLLDDDATFLRAALHRNGAKVTAQRFICGESATLNAACSEGRMLGHAAFRVIEQLPGNGPSTIVASVENEQMSRTAQVLIEALGLGGLCGFDFILTPEGSAYFLELNPRVTLTAQLRGPGDVGLQQLWARSLGIGDDLPTLPVAQASSLESVQYRVRELGAARTGGEEFAALQQHWGQAGILPMRRRIRRYLRRY